MMRTRANSPISPISNLRPLRCNPVLRARTRTVVFPSLQCTLIACLPVHDVHFTLVLHHSASCWSACYCLRTNPPSLAILTVIALSPFLPYPGSCIVAHLLDHILCYVCHELREPGFIYWPPAHSEYESPVQDLLIAHTLERYAATFAEGAA